MAVTASAEIVPDQSIDLSFSTYCLVQGLIIKEGDVVQAGEILATQDNMAQLESSLEAARQALVSAQKDYDRLLENVPVERATAQLDLVKAQKALEDAQKESRSKRYQRASQETIDIARARLIEANEALSDAESAFGNVAARNHEDVVYAAGLTALARARQDQIRAQYNLNYALGLPSPLDVEEAETSLTLAEAEVLSAKQAWERVKNGDPDDQQSAAILARITSAQAALDSAQLALDHAVLRAPFSGAVISVTAVNGQVVNPGQPVVTIATLDNLLVETTDLSERDIAHVSVGQPARVTVEGLDQTYIGKVIKIDPRSTKVGGDVVYKVTIQLDEQPAGLLWGMSATAQIGQ
jgi:multidrug resistance efflux pump